MRELPKGWVDVSIGDITSDVSYGVTAKSDPIDGELKLLRITDIQDNKVNWATVPFCDYEAKFESSRLKNNDIVVARTGATVGKSFLIEHAEENSVYASYLIRLRLTDGTLPKYLANFLHTPSYWQQISEQKAGIGQPNVNGTKLKTLRVPLAPLPEQKRIVEKLDEVLAQVDIIKARLDGIPDLLKRFRQSVLASAVSGKLTEEWRETNDLGDANEELEANYLGKSGKLKLRGKQASFSDLNLMTLPKSWTWVKNYKLAKDESNAICAGPFGTIFKAKDFREEGVPIIFLRHVKEIGFNQDKPNFMDVEVWEELHQEYSVHGGELLVTKLGDPPGECCIYPEGLGKAMVTPDVLKMDVDENIAHKNYLRAYFNSPISKEIIEGLAFGATRLRIDIAMFKGFPIPLPTMSEQNEIVRLVDQYFAFADTIEAQVKKAQARVDNLTQSILAKAFRGELVPQNDDDEPAEVLLERIAQARKEAEVLAKAAKKAGKKKA